MGIPRYYRWCSQRYPCVNDLAKEHPTTPSVDNLYVDVNGVIHQSTHNNDHRKITSESEEHMTKSMQRMFNYLDTIVRFTAPEKLIYLAVDGVAPRAKLNQQRIRRLRQSKEAEQAQQKERRVAENKRQKGLPYSPEVFEGEAFDSNCITPGTEFMERLDNHLRFYVRRKMAEDPLWQKPRVILSGSLVPGEGEHKIMDYIRDRRQSPDYVPNQRHCIYGSDGDLLLLALVTHEPHFYLLREYVEYNTTFKGQPDRTKFDNPGVEDFVFFQVSMLREYIGLEFSSVVLPPNFEGGFDVERIIDDFVLLW